MKTNTEGGYSPHSPPLDTPLGSAEEELNLSLCTDNTVNYAHSNYPQSIIIQTFPNQADSTLPVIIHTCSNGAKDLSVLIPNPEQQTCVALHNIKSLKLSVPIFSQ